MKATPKDIDVLVAVRRVLKHLRQEAEQALDKIYPTGEDHDRNPITINEWHFFSSVIAFAKRASIREITSSRLNRLIKLGKLESRPTDGLGNEIRVPPEL